VRFDAGSRALYSTDASNYRQIPIGVVIPHDADAVVETIAICHRFDAPVLPRGGGTSLAGQSCNVAVVIDMSKYMREVISVDPQKQQARVQPGVVLDDLREAAERHHLTFGPDPATHTHCTLGGMIGNNSCGVHSIMAGKTDANIEELEVVTYDGLRMRVGATSDAELEQIIRGGGRRGEIYGRMKAIRDRYADQIRERFPKIPRRVSGFALEQLLPENGFHVARALVGTEGTCVTVLEATTRLVHSPPGRALLVLGYPDIYSACDHIPELMQHAPIGLEGFDGRMVADMKKKQLDLPDLKLFPDGNGFLIAEFGAGTRQETAAGARDLMQMLERKRDAPHAVVIEDPRDQARIWRVRESALGAVAVVPGAPRFWPGWEDSAVEPNRFGEYLRDLRSLMNRFGYDGSFYGHFGQGCLHTRIDFDLVTNQGIEKFRDFMGEAADLVVHYGGSLSGEHGDGQARAALLPKMYGPELVEAFREFKTAWDPDGKMNPGKVVDPYPITSNLRLGPTYNPPQPQTHFQFPDDNGSFTEATLRCVGVGKCRRESGGTMCPSYMATREEADSTRGRARLLFEMLQGDPLNEGWRSEHVKDALDLCLACKGCKGDCPVNVDMATYKAEFLSHYYAGRLRPLSAYSMGLIYWWSRLAARAPALANFLTHAPLLGAVSKRLAGVAPQRAMPSFAPQTLTQWFRRRPPRNLDKPKVILWPDTFNNHFYPQTGKATVEVLEAAGFQVVVPEASLCCGRPLYDFGMLNLAERLLRQILEVLRDEIRAGVPVVGMEPSCVSVFRDELINLFPHDEDAKRLSGQTFLLSEFLQQHAKDFAPPKLERAAVVHGHCHHKSMLGMEAETVLLDKLGLDYRVLDDGCCGMAGAFGFERDHFEVSVACGERVLLPAVRGAGAESLIITDGFSCRQQIEQTTDRRALHVADVLVMSMRQESGESPGNEPDERTGGGRTSGVLPRLAVAGAAASIGGLVAWNLIRRRSA
jgi:FAD/FMN-containing dehydrogenase/Fe-S oxidoreductase